MSKLWIGLLVFCSMNSYASDFKLMELNEAFVDYKKIVFGIEPFLTNNNYTPTSALDVHLNLGLFNNVVYINNMIHSETDQTQFRVIGWNYQVGIHLGRSVDIFIDHFSQHLLDAVPTSGNVYDAIGVRIYLYRRD